MLEVLTPVVVFFSSRRRHTRYWRDWSSDVCSSDLEAVAYVRRARGTRKRPPGGWESLTPTELEIVRHAAAGLTNPEISERMFISRGTVKVHLSHIYAKLGLRNRSEVAAEATRRHSRGHT